MKASEREYVLDLLGGESDYMPLLDTIESSSDPFRIISLNTSSDLDDVRE
jgi:hypothetical protein